MSLQIVTSIETERGCGYRYAGGGGYGLYLVGAGGLESCERLPFPLTVCPCCGQGIKFGRGVQEIDPVKLFAPALEPTCHVGTGDGRDHHHSACYMCNPNIASYPAGQFEPEIPAYLMWVGRQFYKTPADFSKEVHMCGPDGLPRGISKRIKSTPRGFIPGKSVVYLAHLDAVQPGNPLDSPVEIATLDGPQLAFLPPAMPGVFSVFRAKLDIVVDTEKPDEIPVYARELAERWGDAARLVRVVRATAPVME